MIFGRSRTPLTVWFAACWEFTMAKDGVLALSLQRTLEIGSYQTAWAMLHRLRSVLVHPVRNRLSGTVEVDETYFGGDEPGLRGGRQKGKTVLVGVAVEPREPHGLGRCRMWVLRDGSTDSLVSFVAKNVKEGTTTITDGRPGHNGIVRPGYVHEPRSQQAAKARGEDMSALLPGVHRVASLSKRWLASTHQGRFDPGHLPGYLNEFVFRFNRRRSKSRGLLFFRLLELSVGHCPVRYHDIAIGGRPRKVMPLPPPRKRGTRPALNDYWPIVLGGSLTWTAPVSWRSLPANTDPR
jgi:transposase-like protein